MHSGAGRGPEPTRGTHEVLLNVREVLPVLLQSLLEKAGLGGRPLLHLVPAEHGPALRHQRRDGLGDVVHALVQCVHGMELAGHTGVTQAHRPRGETTVPGAAAGPGVPGPPRGSLPGRAAGLSWRAWTARPACPGWRGDPRGKRGSDTAGPSRPQQHTCVQIPAPGPLTKVMSREAAAALMCRLGCRTELLQSRARAKVPTELGAVGAQ